MIVISECVFDEVIHGAATDYYTANKYNELLGRADKLTIQALVDNVETGSGTISVRIEHSGDQRNWKPKNGTDEIITVSISTSATTSTIGSDSGSTASLPFVRLRVVLATATRAHVKLFVCGRDS
jgi:hypothetical protein